MGAVALAGRVAFGVCWWGVCVRRVLVRGACVRHVLVRSVCVRHVLVGCVCQAYVGEGCMCQACVGGAVSGVIWWGCPGLSVEPGVQTLA